MSNGFEKGPEVKKNPRLWRVELRGSEIIGLPEGVSPHDVLLFKENDGSWWAANPSKEILEEIKMWRTDWMDTKGSG
ncbi:MAG: hypothetical protein Q7R98_00950 [Candidatus Jorgensenbacteria bacterium]|nr:hypothetical protein [Candidatus Jorgensenbacteria bacterium]